MLAVRVPEADVLPWLGDDLSIAAVNGPAVTVLSGTDQAIDALMLKLSEEDIFCKKLVTSHGFHSPMMDPILETFQRAVDKQILNDPVLPWVSTVTGKLVDRNVVCEPRYWSDQIRRTVRFADALGVVLESPDMAVLEVGPGAALSNLALQHPAREREQAVFASLSRNHAAEEDYDALMLTLGELWTAGVDVDWSTLYSAEQRMRVRLPTYPFERKRFWVEPKAQEQCGEISACTSLSDSATTEVVDRQSDDRPADHRAEQPFERELGQLVLDLSGVDLMGMGSGVTFAEVGIDSLLALRLFALIESKFGVSLPLATLINAPTISLLAKKVQEQAGEAAKTQELLVEMTSDVLDKKMFLIHAGEGGILFYKDFAEELRSVCSVYGLEAPWLMSEEVPAENMKEVAATYLSMIRKVQPEGPYMIAGFCYGGVVAFEMATQLKAAGESVSTLVLFDANNPMNAPIRYGAWKRFLINLELIREKRFGEQVQIIAERATGKFRANMNDFKRMVKYRRGKVSEKITGKESIDKRVEEMREYHERLFFEYKPQPYSGDMVLIEGMDREPMYKYPEKLGWIPIIKGELRSYKVPAEHLTMLNYPSAIQVGEIVASEIAKNY